MRAEQNSRNTLFQSLNEYSSGASVLGTATYRPHYMTGEAANTLPWNRFVDQARPLSSREIPNTDLEVAVIPKSHTWSQRDINIYVGSPTREIRDFTDFSSQEFGLVMDWHVAVAKQIASQTGEEVYVTHGFNPDDTAPDAHSVRAKFHTHITIPDTEGITTKSVNELTVFERLTLIEPFSDVYWDYVRNHAMKDNPNFALSRSKGYFSAATEIAERNVDPYERVYDTLLAMKGKYDEVVGVITDGQEEEQTGYQRFIPRPRAEREAGMETFIEVNSEWLGDRASGLLRHLATDIQPAEPRNAPGSTAINSARQLWIAKGFSGALNFVVSPDSDEVVFNFAPRVISTSGATKIISPEPVIIIKGIAEVTGEQLATLEGFERMVTGAAENTSFLSR